MNPIHYSIPPTPFNSPDKSSVWASVKENDLPPLICIDDSPRLPLDPLERELLFQSTPPIPIPLKTVQKTNEQWNIVYFGD